MSGPLGCGSSPAPIDAPSVVDAGTDAGEPGTDAGEPSTDAGIDGGPGDTPRAACEEIVALCPGLIDDCTAATGTCDPLDLPLVLECLRESSCTVTTLLTCYDRVPCEPR